MGMIRRNEGFAKANGAIGEIHGILFIVSIIVLFRIK